MKNPLTLALLVVAILAASVYLYTNKRSNVSDAPSMPSDSIMTEDEPMVTPNSAVDSLRVGGSSYSDPAGLYTLLYPNDYQLDTSDPAHPRIFKSGPSQRPQSEMSDGALVVFESVDLTGKTLEQVVDERIQALESNGVSEISSPKKAIVLNGYSGFTYEERGLGSATNIFIQKDPTSTEALLITYLVADPEGKNYQQEVDALLSTIELRK